MIKHIVMWKVKGSTPEEKNEGVRRIQTAFNGLVGVIPGLMALEVGADVSRVGYACDVVLYTEFESREALDSYATHPDHLRIKRELADIRIDRHQVDYVGFTSISRAYLSPMP